MPDGGRIEARYSNHVEIGSNAFEFLLDFGQAYDSPEQGALIHTRIILSPFYAKHFSELLDASVRQYEEQFGTIPSE